MKNIKLSIYLFISICLVICLPSVRGLGQGSSLADTINLDEVSINALRTDIPLKEIPGTISVVQRHDLYNMQKTIAADEALRLVPGIKIDNGTGGSRIHMYMRGQGILSERGIRGIQVLIDGLPVNDPGGYCPDLYDIDWQTVDNIQVVRGLAASMYGSGATGGIVDITTLSGGPKPVQSTLYGSGGSYGFWKILGQVDGTQGDVNYRVSYSHVQGHGYRNHQAFLGDNFYEKMSWTPNSKVKLTQILSYTNYFNQNSEGINLYREEQFGSRAANTDAAPYNEFQKTQRITGGIILDYAVAKNQQLTLKGMIRPYTYMEQSNGGVDYKSILNPYASAQYMIHFGSEKVRNHLGVGADFNSQNTTEHNFAVPSGDEIDKNREDNYFGQETFETNRLQINQLINQRSAGVYLIDKLDFGKKLFAMLNVRYDYIYNKLTDKMDYSTPDSLMSGDKVFNKSTWRFGIVYNPLKAIGLYADFGSGFLPPTGDELYNNPVRWGGFNDSIEPSTSMGGELGIRGEPCKSLYYNVTGFYIDTKNEFYRYRVPWMGNTSDVYANIGGSTRWGIETFVSYAPLKNLVFDVSYTYSHFKYTDPDSISGQWIPESPQHMLVVQGSYNFLKHFAVAANVQYQSKWCIFADSTHYDHYTLGATEYQPANTYSSWVDGFTLVSLDLHYYWKIGWMRGDLGFYVKNLFDEHYYGFTEPDNPPDYNNYQPAPGREFFVSLKLNF